MSGGIIVTSPVVVRDQIRRAAEGFTSETLPRSLAGSGIVLTGGTVYGTLIGLSVGDVVTNITIAVFTNGSGTNLSKVGLYDTSGNRLAVSADQGTAWNSTGLKTVAMSSAYTVTTSGGYYVAVIANASSTVPALARGSSSGAYFGSASGITALTVQESGQTDLDATCTFSSSGTQYAIWAAVS